MSWGRKKNDRNDEDETDVGCNHTARNVDRGDHIAKVCTKCHVTVEINPK